MWNADYVLQQLPCVRNSAAKCQLNAQLSGLEGLTKNGKYIYICIYTIYIYIFMQCLFVSQADKLSKRVKCAETEVKPSKTW